MRSNPWIILLLTICRWTPVRAEKVGLLTVHRPWIQPLNKATETYAKYSTQVRALTLPTHWTELIFDLLHKEKLLHLF
jgi:hypothetical protein